jgi:hypothetical protein
VETSQALDSLVAKLEEDKHLVWNQADALDLCVLLEQLAPEFGAHVALTGGCLYKDGRRKDADILFYRIRQQDHIDERGLLKAMIERMGIKILKRHGWVVKAEFDNKPIDLFFPEENKNQQRLTTQCTHRISSVTLAQIGHSRPRPTTGDALGYTMQCPMCYNEMQYSINADAWLHPRAPEPTSLPTHARCILCNSTYVYDDGDPKYCPKCQGQGLTLKPSASTATNRTQITTFGSGLASAGIINTTGKILDDY